MTAAAWLCRAVLAGVVLAGAGCATRPPLQVDAGALARGVDLSAQVPFHPQTRYQCGPAALAGVLGASGIPATPEDLESQVYLPGRQGSLQVELFGATRRAGRIPYPVAGTAQALVAELQAGRPVLVLQNLLTRSVPKWHYAVVVGMQPGGGRVRLNSGIRQGQWQSSSKFMRTWDWGGRWAMLALQPGELPADADPLRYLSAVADFEAVAGADAAAPAWAAAQQRWPGEPRVYLALGNQAHAAGDLAAAAGLYRQGLAHAPGEPVLSNNYASVMAGLGCPAQALAALDAVAAAAGSPWQAQLAQTRREVQALPSAGRAPAAQCVPLALSLP